MTRHLLIAGFIFSSSTIAHAEIADDKPTTDEAVEALDVSAEVAEKKGSKGRSGGKPAARSSSSTRSAASRSNASSAASRSSASRSSASRSSSPPPRSSNASSAATPSHRSSNAASAPPPPRPSSASSRPSSASSSRSSSPPPRSSSAGHGPGNSSASHAAVANSSRPVHSSSSSRPSSRPSHRVYRANWAPKRWAPSYHRYHIKGVPRYSPRYWGAGVFYYNPPPRRHRTVVVNRTVTGSKAGRSDTSPNRAIDRNGDFAFGLRGGTYGTEYLGGGGYSDAGIGLTARFRPVEAIGLEVAYEHHSQNFEDDTERINNPLQTSVQVYAFPWTRVSPYATLGLTWNSRSLTDTYYNNETFSYDVAEAQDTLFGPHAGLGLELALGESAALNFEGRYINYLNVEQDDVSAPAAVQGTAGVNFYF